MFDLCKRIVDAHLSPAVECVRLIIGSFCCVDYLPNKGFCTGAQADSVARGSEFRLRKASWVMS